MEIVGIEIKKMYKKKGLGFFPEKLTMTGQDERQ
jgi:hypothetical protein